MFRITDRFGDAITICPLDGHVDITIDEGETQACVVIDPDQAEQVAAAILDVIGRKTVALDSIPSASNVSFNEALLRVAAVHKRTVTFRYAKQNGDYIETRRLNPTSIVGSGLTLGVEGTDPDREAPRRFKLSRIKGEVSFA